LASLGTVIFGNGVPKSFAMIGAQAASAEAEAHPLDAELARVAFLAVQIGSVLADFRTIQHLTA